MSARKKKVARRDGPPSRGPVRVGVIGLGFIGRLHVEAYRAADAAGFPNRLVAVCDPDPARRAGRVPAGGNLGRTEAADRLFDPREVGGHAEAAELLARDDIDLVSICTWTDTHVDLALAALAAGKHVLVEKPIALRERPAARLAAAARAARTLCMPALCMRFWPGWAWLRDIVAGCRLGAVQSATFRRLAARPSWGAGFYSDPARSGGALFDLHVHDADFVAWVFGPPRAVTSAGSADHLTTLYHYDAPGPPHVVAEGGWDHAEGFPFRMGFTVVFEKATAEYDSTRTPPLLVWRGGEAQAPELPEGTGYDGEVRHILSAIRRGAARLQSTCDEAEELTRRLVAEQRSLETGLRVEL